MSDDAPRRDPIAEQDEAARRFEERTGRSSTAPAPPGAMRIRIHPGGRIEVETYGYDRDPDDEFDPFERAGVERIHHAPAEIEQTPTGVFGRFPSGTDPRLAISEVFATMFPGGTAAPSPFPDAIDVDVVDDDEVIQSDGA